jgi:hypothetical protein
MARDKLKAMDVVVEEVGQPLSDLSKGSGLYEVPIRLNRRPTEQEERLLLQAWNRPGSRMHRPGAAKVYADRFVINATIEEVRDYHAETLKEVIERVNQLLDLLAEKEARQREAQTEEADKHRAHVEEVAKEIDFE